MKQDLSFWQEHMAAIERAGISTSAYAKRHGLPIKRLYYWLNKVRLAATPTEVIARKAFVAVRVGEPVAVAAPMGCVLTLACGMRLEMSDLPSPGWLMALNRSAQGAR